MGFEHLFLGKGRTGTNSHPRWGSDARIEVHHDGFVSLYERPDDLEAFKVWAECAWGLLEDEQGEWSGNRLHLDQ